MDPSMRYVLTFGSCPFALFSRVLVPGQAQQQHQYHHPRFILPWHHAFSLRMPLGLEAK
jgi:hypothetical protein